MFRRFSVLAIMLSAGLITLSLAGCQEPRGTEPLGSTQIPVPEQAEPASPPIEVQAHLDATRQSLADAVSEDDTLPGASVYIIAPGLGIEWGTGVGYADVASERPFTSSVPVRISSVTKPFVAAAVFRLVEQGQIELNEPISTYLKPEHVEMMRPSAYNPDVLTVRHLLTHTSGLFDTFLSEPFQAYMASVLDGAETRTFTLEEQLGYAIGTEPTGAPGERQQYTDTGYILLGAILEQVTGQNMAAATRSLSRYGEFDLQNTWWEVFEAPPVGSLPRANQYYGAFNGDDFGEAPFDLFGGGGMISSTEDLSRWFWALFHDQVFDRPETLSLMQSKLVPETYEGDPDELLRHGLQGWVLEGRTVYGHGGWWGVSVYFSPEDDVLVATNWLQQHAGEQMGSLARGIFEETVRLSERQSGNL